MTELKPIFEQWAKEKYPTSGYGDSWELLNEDKQASYIAALHDKLADVAVKYHNWAYDNMNNLGLAHIRTDEELFTYFIKYIYGRV